MRLLLLACAAALGLSGPALAQTTTTAPPIAAPNVAAPGITGPSANARVGLPPAPESPVLQQVQHLLAANWRPVVIPEGGDALAVFQTACNGAAEEVTALNHQLGPNLTAEQLHAIRNPRGLIITPNASSAARVVVFSSAALTWLESGSGTLNIVDLDHARIDLRDAHGAVAQLQLAQQAGQPVMRVSHNDQPVGLFVACVPTAG